jgi:monofunctional glycosyltransferase
MRPGKKQKTKSNKKDLFPIGGRRWRRLMGWVGFLWLIAVLFSILQVLVFRFVNPPFTAMMGWRSLRHMDLSELKGLREGWKPLERISPHMRRAVLAGEDQRFLSHTGFDFIEMNAAMVEFMQGEGRRGASTISMQVARTVYLWPDRTWARKLAEAYYTFIIEMIWTKERILEVYLNTVDWGPGVMGVQAASMRYFRRPADQISRHQAALLTAILPSPHRWSAVNPGPVVLRRQARILRDMEKMPLLQ